MILYITISIHISTLYIYLRFNFTTKTLGSFTLGSFRVKIANFSSFFCLSIPKRQLDTKKTTPNIEV